MTRPQRWTCHRGGRHVDTGRCSLGGYHPGGPMIHPISREVERHGLWSRVGAALRFPLGLVGLLLARIGAALIKSSGKVKG